MPKHLNKLVVPFTQGQLFSLVMDIEKYPEFLPWCSKAKILKNNDVIIAELEIKFQAFYQSYTSIITVDEPNSIVVKQTKGPFKFLTNQWQFNKIDDDKTELIFEINFCFKSKLLSSLIGVFFEESVKKISNAFITRANKIYGKNFSI